MKQYVVSGTAVLCAALLSGCASTGVVRTDVNRARPLTEKWDPDDARKTVEKMVDSMLVFRPVVEITQQRRPVLDVEQIKNATMQHIDTKSLTDSVRTRLIRSGQFRFKDRSTTGDMLEVMNEENELGLVDRSKAVKPGQQLATEFLLNGRITEMRSSAGRVVDQYYKITMNLKSLKTGELIWSDEQEIRKERKRALVGG